MKYNVLAVSDISGFVIFQGTMVYLPRIGEEIEVDMIVYKIKNIRHIIKEETQTFSDVVLYLAIV